MSAQQGAFDPKVMLSILQLIRAGKAGEAWDALADYDTSMEVVKRQTDPHNLQAYTVIANLIGAMALIRLEQSDDAYSLVQGALQNFAEYVGS